MSLISRRLAARHGDHDTPAEEPRRPRRPAQRSPEMQRALDYMAAHPLDGSLDSRLDARDEENADTRSLLERLLGGAR